ncbi:MAG: aminopeptidase P family protein [Bradyrhizobium sp.]|uniref:M24 family metallopeptidase n=1 Tax=Bradyrhizobium sp. TaxID=376 RepID=UPI00121A564F|nr:Xaa-Pro peptidase family protein [Bradyrhizobium sp.]THD72737.1 MAG: aminopeptidase P family protein [Bradyrhizobium sp.]
MDFPIAEYKSRLARTQAEIRARKLDALLVHQPENVLYLSGFHTTGFFMYHALVVPTEGEPVLILRGMEDQAAAATSWVEQRFTYADTEEPISATRRALQALKLDAAKIGIDHHSWFLTLDRYATLRELLPRVRFERDDQTIDRQRLIKTPLEIEALRTAARIVEAGVQAGIDAIAPDVSERDLAKAIFTALIDAGGEPPLFGNITTGPRTLQLHGQWTDRRIERGDQIYYEISGVSRHYFSKLMRTTVLGEPSADQSRTAEILLRAQDEGIAKMRAGAAAIDIDRACRDPVLRAGLRETYPNRVGYSTGLTYRPSSGEFLREFMPDSDWTLEAGMVLHMLLMAKGIGFSDTILVTEGGPEYLTRFDRKLFVR